MQVHNHSCYCWPAPVHLPSPSEDISTFQLLPVITADTCRLEKAVQKNLYTKSIAYDTECYYNESVCNGETVPVYDIRS